MGDARVYNEATPGALAPLEAKNPHRVRISGSDDAVRQVSAGESIGALCDRRNTAAAGLFPPRTAPLARCRCCPGFGGGTSAAAGRTKVGTAEHDTEVTHGNGHGGPAMMGHMCENGVSRVRTAPVQGGEVLLIPVPLVVWIGQELAPRIPAPPTGGTSAEWTPPRFLIPSGHGMIPCLWFRHSYTDISTVVPELTIGRADRC
jgi:hypothetical protein